jgi:F0F1-type ATP synthase assembly protein I
MQHSAYDRVDFIAIVIGAVVSGVFFLTSGVMSGASALAGCMLGVLNFAALRFILSRLLSNMDDTKNAASMSALFFVKLIGLVAVLYLLANVVERLDGLALAVGFLSILVSVTFAGLLWKSELLGAPTSQDSSSGEKAIS